MSALKQMLIMVHMSLMPSVWVSRPLQLPDDVDPQQISISCRYTAVLQVQRAMREYSRAARRYALQTAAALRLQAAARGWAARRQASSSLMQSSHIRRCLCAIRWVRQRLTT